MTFTASGEGHDDGHPGEAASRARTRGRRRRRVPPVSVALSALLLAGIVALAIPGVVPTGDTSGSGSSAPLEAYVARPTPAIDALDDKPALWTNAETPEPLYQLRTQELLDLPARYAAREHGLGGREDVLAFGDYHGEGLHLRLSVYRMGKEAPRPSTFFVDLARRSAEAGVGVTGMGPPVAEDTKFGPTEIADARLNLDGDERACQAFRLMTTAEGEQTSWQISGWVCDAAPVAPLEIACFLDHLSVTEAAHDTSLSRLFARANERRRPECGGVPQPIPPKGA